MHDIDFEHEHAQLSEADKLEMAKFIWSQESVELNTIGIDIGSSAPEGRKTRRSLALFIGGYEARPLFRPRRLAVCECLSSGRRFKFV